VVFFIIDSGDFGSLYAASVPPADVIIGIFGLYEGVGGSVESAICVLFGFEKEGTYRRMQKPSKMPPPPEAEEAIPLEPAVASQRVQYIRAMVQNVKTLKAQGKSKEEVKEELPKFAEDYPALFKMMNSDSYNEGSLRTMIAMLERMGTGEITQHQASSVIGQQLHDVYIKPKIDQMERK